jgi:Ran GTPase-activating protein (RanGAP) involved in mRNA processing and transport
MKFSKLDDFIQDATHRMESGDSSFRTLDITNPVAENHLEGENSRFADDIDESLENEMVIQLLESARSKGHLVDDLFLGFFQIDHEISLALVQLLQDERRIWKRLAIQRCPGRVLESSLAIAATRGNLEILSLYQNNLGYTGFSSLAMILACNPPKLVKLDLEDYISPNSAEALAAGLQANTTLRTLDLHDCRFDRDALENIAKGVAQHRFLRHLQLSDCQLTDMNASLIITTLLDHPSLSHIYLGTNYCCVKSMKALAAAIRDNRMRELESVSLVHQCTRLDPRLALPLPIGMLGGPLESNATLKELSLSNNYLHPAELGFFMTGVKESRLESLKLARCGISDDGLRRVLSNLPCTIKGLDLTENLFASEASNHSLLLSIEYHKQLETLEIDKDLECWHDVCYQARLNRGGRRILSSEKVVPTSLWSLILERINKIDWSSYDAAGEGRGFREDVVFATLKGPAFCGR